MASKLSAFVAPTGLGEEIALLPLGWMASENDSLVLAVLLSLDANTEQISLLRQVSEGGFAGFVY